VRLLGALGLLGAFRPLGRLAGFLVNGLRGAAGNLLGRPTALVAQGITEPTQRGREDYNGR
jgi:hypothetical protein